MTTMPDTVGFATTSTEPDNSCRSDRPCCLALTPIWIFRLLLLFRVSARGPAYQQSGAVSLQRPGDAAVRPRGLEPLNMRSRITSKAPEHAPTCAYITWDFE